MREADLLRRGDAALGLEDDDDDDFDTQSVLGLYLGILLVLSLVSVLAFSLAHSNTVRQYAQENFHRWRMRFKELGECQRAELTGEQALPLLYLKENRRGQVQGPMSCLSLRQARRRLQNRRPQQPNRRSRAITVDPEV